ASAGQAAHPMAGHRRDRRSGARPVHGGPGRRADEPRRDPARHAALRRRMAGLDWGVSAIAMAFEPPAAEPGMLKRAALPAPAAGLIDAVVQAEPARRLKNLAGIPMLLVTAEASWMA